MPQTDADTVFHLYILYVAVDWIPFENANQASSPIQESSHSD